MKTIEEIARKAAEWWVDKICCPKFDNGDTSATGGMTMMLAMVATKNVSRDESYLFVKSLTRKITTLLQDGNRNITLSVDYHPDRLLSQSANDAGISLMNFPWKTTMWISNHHIAVRYGHCAQREYLSIDAIYCDEQIESYKRGIIHCQNESNFLYYEDAIKRKERMAEAEAEAMSQLIFWENKKVEVEAGKGC